MTRIEIFVVGFVIFGASWWGAVVAAIWLKPIFDRWRRSRREASAEAEPLDPQRFAISTISANSITTGTLSAGSVTTYELGELTIGGFPKDWQAWHLENVRKLDREKVLASVAFLREELKGQVGVIREWADKDPEWWCQHHFLGMMSIRNTLRRGGFGEKEFGIDNLDDYAVGLVELAVGVTEL